MRRIVFFLVIAQLFEGVALRNTACRLGTARKKDVKMKVYP
jgi:hypothetical protein